jgi:hypothetical protein
MIFFLIFVLLICPLLRSLYACLSLNANQVLDRRTSRQEAYLPRGKSRHVTLQEEGNELLGK